MRNCVLQFVLTGMVLVLSGCDQKTAQEANTTAAPAKSTLIPQSELDRAQIARGKQVYDNNCQQCHGVDGKGQPGDWRQRKPDGLFPPPPLDDTAHAWHHPTEVLIGALKRGSPPGVGDMPSWEGKLTEAEMNDVIVYVKSLWSAEIYQHWLKIEKNYLEN